MWAVVAYGLALALPAASVLGVLVAFAIGNLQTDAATAASTVRTRARDGGGLQGLAGPTQHARQRTADCNASSAAALTERRHVAWRLDGNGSTLTQGELCAHRPGSHGPALPMVTHRLCVDVRLPLALAGCAASLRETSCLIACNLALHDVIEPQVLPLQPEQRVADAVPPSCAAMQSAATA